MKRGGSCSSASAGANCSGLPSIAVEGIPDHLRRVGAARPKSGQHVNFDLGGNGAQIRGRVALNGDAAHDIDLNYSLNWLVQKAPGIEPPAVIAGQEFDWRRGWNDSWSNSAEGNIYRQTLHHYFVKLARDGTLLISGVPAGDYDLAFKIYERPEGCLVDPVGARVVRFRVAESDVAKGSLDLRVIEIDAALGSKPGELVPDFDFETLDGSQKTLSQLRGGYVLINFWATWCNPCVAGLPAVRAIHDEYRAGDRLVVLGLSVDADEGVLASSSSSAAYLGCRDFWRFVRRKNPHTVRRQFGAGLRSHRSGRKAGRQVLFHRQGKREDSRSLGSRRATSRQVSTSGLFARTATKLACTRGELLS